MVWPFGRDKRYSKEILPFSDNCQLNLQLKSLMNFLSSIFKGILTYNVDHDLLFAAKTIGDLKVFCKNDVDHDLLFAANFQDFLRIFLLMRFEFA